MVELSSKSNKYHVESVKTSGFLSLEKDWLALQKKADCSFFQSWSWIGAWLKTVVVDLSPTIIKVSYGDKLVGLAVFIDKNICRHKIISSHASFLNEAPFDNRNMVIEYNGILSDKNHENEVNEAVQKYLLLQHPEIDEFYYGAVSSDLELEYAKENTSKYSANVKCIEESNTWFVKLDEVGETVDEYLKTIGKNRRLQIKRSLRLYEQDSKVKIIEAESLDQALGFFDRLKVMHTQRWQRDGKQGSFGNPTWESFHREIIYNCFNKGEVQLLRVHNQEGDIGYLYNFIWRDRVYVLQTGFAEEIDKRLIPGYVSHVLAIVLNKNKGHNIYDLMHGYNLYKKQLCNSSDKLFWMVIQRRKLKFTMEGVLRYIYRAVF